MSTDSAAMTLDREIVSQLLREVSSCLLQMDAQGTIKAWTKENERMFGSPAENVVGSINVADLFAARAEGEELLAKLREGQRVEMNTDMARLSGGSFPSRVIFAAKAPDLVDSASFKCCIG